MAVLRVRRLSTQIFAWQLLILTATVVIGFALFARHERAQLDRHYEMRSATIAQVVAGIPDVAACLMHTPACREPIQSVATRVQRETGASYVVVIDMDRVRHSHPIVSLIGQRVEEPIVTADGRVHVGVDDGATGRSANGRAPLYGPDGRMLGEVSVGIREKSVTHALWAELPTYALWFAIALVAGALASLLLAQRLKRRTFGLELDEIALLLREREATLHGIREGVVAADPSGRITMINDEARRLLGIGMHPVDRLDALLPPGRLLDVLSGEQVARDEVVLTDDHCLVVNRMPVALAGRPHGTVVTLRDRTELSGLLRELDGVRRLTDSLRAQHHEFTNRMHTVAGLLELGEPEEALGYLDAVTTHEAGLADAVRERISSPLVVGLLLGKAASSSERDVELTLSPDSWLGETPEKAQALTTVLGNLIDNALDALAEGTPHGPGRIEVTIVEDDDALLVEVADNGPGIPSDALGRIFVDGFTTKAAAPGVRRGLGLALVHRLVQRLGGTIEVASDAGARFVVRLPRAAVRPPALVATGGEPA